MPIALRTVVRRGGLAILLAVIVNGAILAATLASGLVEPFGALTAPPVVLLTILGGVAATAVYGAITRVSPRPNWLFTRLAVVALVVSFIPDLIVLRYDESATLGAVLVLMLMHVTAAAVMVPILTGGGVSFGGNER